MVVTKNKPLKVCLTFGPLGDCHETAALVVLSRRHFNSLPTLVVLSRRHFNSLPTLVVLSRRHFNSLPTVGYLLDVFITFHGPYFHFCLELALET